MKSRLTLTAILMGFLAYPAAAQSHSAAAHPAVIAAGHSTSSEIGQSHYPDGHTVIYSGEHVAAGSSGSREARSSASPMHGSGHGGHSYGNSRHDHHPYVTLGR